MRKKHSQTADYVLGEAPPRTRDGSRTFLQPQVADGVVDHQTLELA